MSKWTRLTPEGGDSGVTRYRKGLIRHCHVLQVEGNYPIQLSDAELLALITASGLVGQLPEIQALIAGMRRHEWWASDFGDCPSCEACEGDGHKPDCQWVAAMAPFKGVSSE